MRRVHPQYVGRFPRCKDYFQAQLETESVVYVSILLLPAH